MFSAIILTYYSVDRYQDATNISRLKQKHVFDQVRHKQTVNPTGKFKNKITWNSNNFEKSNTFSWNHGISFLIRELGNNQIKELPPGVFNNNTKLTELYVIDFPGSCDDSFWCAKSLIFLLIKCDQEGSEA